MSVVSPIFPVLALATIGATVRERGHNVEILDLSYLSYDYDIIRKKIIAYQPDIIGITVLTPLANQLIDMSILIKDISKKIIVVAGGPHPSSLPEETIKQSLVDAVVVGEGDYTFAEICDGWDFKDIKGLCYRESDEIIFTGHRTPVSNLDELPMPAWDLYDAKIYTDKISRLLVKRPPVTTVEFSRGCIFKCDYCASKMTLALGYRKKSPKRCAEEVQYLYSLGYKEFMIADDIFTSDEKWAVKVCEAIIDTGIDMTWSALNGIRVESSDENLYHAMKKAGCYRVSFGFESGNDEVLKKFGKGGKASLLMGRRAVRMVRESGIEANGYFMLGLSCDTEDTMRDTINFAKQLPLDMLKFSRTIAFPGTKMFNDYVDKGLIKSFNWDDYHIYSDVDLFTHEHLSNEKTIEFMNKAFCEVILMNPKFIIRRIFRGLKTQEFFWDIYYFFKFIFAKTTNTSKQKTYYAENRWPLIDFVKDKPKPALYQKVTKSSKTSISSYELGKNEASTPSNEFLKAS